MSATAAVMLILGLIALAFGLGIAFGRLRWIGLMPLAVLLIYYVANALARTSGGRYLVPVDWIVLCYFGVGLAEMLQLGGSLVGTGSGSAPVLSEPSADTSGISTRSAIVGLVCVAAIGALIPLAGVLYPPRYSPGSSADALVQAQPTLSKLGLTAPDVSALLVQPGAVALYGRALYPRFYPEGGGEPVRYLPFRTADYPRTVFILIGPVGQQYVILPGPAPKVLPNASDVLVLGCREFQEGYDMLYAAAVVVPSEGTGYLRSPETATVCSTP